MANPPAPPFLFYAIVSGGGGSSSLQSAHKPRLLKASSARPRPSVRPSSIQPKRSPLPPSSSSSPFPLSVLLGRSLSLSPASFRGMRRRRQCSKRPFLPSSLLLLKIPFALFPFRQRAMEWHGEREADWPRATRRGHRFAIGSSVAKIELIEREREREEISSSTFPTWSARPSRIPPRVVSLEEVRLESPPAPAMSRIS